MIHYHIWCNLADGRRDLEFCRAIEGYLGRLRDEKRIEHYQVERRQFGFGPPELGEFHVRIDVKSLAQLETAFERVAAREGEMESLHAAVYTMVTDFRSGLYRDFPDPQRKQ